MLEMFPKIRRKAYIYTLGFVVLCLVIMAINPAKATFLFVLMVAGAAVLYVMQLINASNAHNQLTDQLYNKLDAAGFLRQYEPFLEKKFSRESIRLMIRLHLSNAYIALGRFDECEKMLSGIKVEAKKEEERLTSEFAITSNLCFCYCQAGDLENAEKYLKQNNEIEQRLIKLQESKPPKKRMVYNSILQNECVKFMRTGHLDVQTLTDKVQAQNAEALHRITTGLWIAKGEIADGDIDKAREMLHNIEKAAPHLYLGQEAKRLLKTMVSDE